MTVRIMLLWQTERDIHGSEIEKLQATYGPKLEFIEKRPRSPDELQKFCEMLRPIFVLAPRKTVNGGPAHLPFTPNGETLARVPHCRFVYECMNAAFTCELVDIKPHNTAGLRHVG